MSEFRSFLKFTFKAVGLLVIIAIIIIICMILAGGVV